MKERNSKMDNVCMFMFFKVLKPFKTLLMAIIMVCFNVNSLAQTTVTVDGVKYNLSGVTATVTYDLNKSYGYKVGNTTYYQSNYEKEEYVIPSSINYNDFEYEVKEIGSAAFAAYVHYEQPWGSDIEEHKISNIKKIYLPKTTEKIGQYAFIGQHGLEFIDMPNVQTIDGSAFKGCTKLQDVNMPNVQTIDRYAFNGCTNLQEVDMPNVQTIGNNAFNGCTNLKKVIIPVVKNIYNGAFANCNNLVSIYIPESMEYFETNVFGGCSLLREIFYFSLTPPSGWVSTTFTYVPDLQAYSSPRYRMNDAHIIEMITFDKKSFEYTGQSPTTTWTNNVEGYTAVLDMSNLNPEVGEHTEIIPATFTKGEESFICNVVYRYTITPATLTAMVPNASREYGEENPKCKITYSGFVNGENESVIEELPTITTSATKTSDVGEYPLTVNGGKTSNYTFEYKQGTLTITKAPLSATIDDVSRLYGAANPAFTISYNGLKNEETVPKWSETLTIETTANEKSDVGTYTITGSGKPVNYELPTITSGNLVITPVPLEIKANDANRLYFDPNPDFTCSYSGFVNEESEDVLSVMPTITCNAKRESVVGQYPIMISGAEAKNYSISYIDGMLTIAPCKLIVSTKDYSRKYGEENPEFEISYQGFVNDENESNLLKKPDVNCIATENTDVGEYPIIISGAEADNYFFEYNNGKLTITIAEQEIIWEQDFDNVQIGDQIELLAYATSGMPIVYDLSDNSIASMYSANNKVYLDCLKEGTIVIRAFQEGNNNYYAAIRKSKTINIGNSSGIENTNIDYNIPTTIYTLDGRKIDSCQKGLNIIRYNDGSIKKMIVR